MEAGEYFQTYIEMAKLDKEFEPFSFELAIMPGETEEDAVERWLEENNIYIEDSDGDVVIDYERAEEIHPTLARILKIREEAILDSSIDDLIEAGVIEASIDETGSPIYLLTSEYKESIENQEDN